MNILVFAETRGSTLRKVALEATTAARALADSIGGEVHAMVFGPLRAIMDEKDASVALTLTQKQLALIDTMLQAPSPSHPLWNLVK